MGSRRMEAKRTKGAPFFKLRQFLPRRGAHGNGRWACRRQTVMAGDGTPVTTGSLPGGGALHTVVPLEGGRIPLSWASGQTWMLLDGHKDAGHQLVE